MDSRVTGGSPGNPAHNLNGAFIMAKQNEKAKFLNVVPGEIASTLTFVLGDGQQLVIDCEMDFGESIRKQAMIHGFNQKIRDAAAGFSKTNDYEGAFEAMAAVIEALKDGEWKRGGGAGAGQVMRDLAAAIAEVRNVPYEKCFAAVSAAEEAKRKEWMKNAKIANIMARIKADRLKAAAEAASDDIDIDLGDDDL